MHKFYWYVFKITGSFLHHFHSTLAFIQQMLEFSSFYNLHFVLFIFYFFADIFYFNLLSVCDCSFDIYVITHLKTLMIIPTFTQFHFEELLILFFIESWDSWLFSFQVISECILAILKFWTSRSYIHPRDNINSFLFWWVINL